MQYYVSDQESHHALQDFWCLIQTWTTLMAAQSQLLNYQASGSVASSVGSPMEPVQPLQEAAPMISSLHSVTLPLHRL